MHVLRATRGAAETGNRATNSNPLDAPRTHFLILLIESIQIVPPSGLEIELDVKMRICILLIYALAFLDDAVDGTFTFPPSLLVRLDRTLTLDDALGYMGGLGARVWVSGENREDLAEEFCVELLPELVDRLLGSLLLYSSRGSAVTGTRGRREAHARYVIFIIHGCHRLVTQPDNCRSAVDKHREVKQ